MLSKWRKDAREGRLRGRARKAPPAGPAREIAQLQALEAKYAELREEHERLKKAIRFCSARRVTSRLHRGRTRAVQRRVALPALRGDVGGVLRLAAPRHERARGAGPEQDRR